MNVCGLWTMDMEPTFAEQHGPSNRLQGAIGGPLETGRAIQPSGPIHEGIVLVLPELESVINHRRASLVRPRLFMHIAAHRAHSVHAEIKCLLMRGQLRIDEERKHESAQTVIDVNGHIPFLFCFAFCVYIFFSFFIFNENQETVT